MTENFTNYCEECDQVNLLVKNVVRLAEVASADADVESRTG
jgi:hypothetical protein